MPARAQSENRVASRRKAARIVALIAHRAGERLSVPRVAAYVGVSNRTLQNWCMAHFGLPPARFLREQRLVRAHHVLLTADPGTITVTTVAVRFGFYHLGRFAVVYREVFGERPSDTLRRPTPRMSGEP